MESSKRIFKKNCLQIIKFKKTEIISKIKLKKFEEHL